MAVGMEPLVKGNPHHSELTVINASWKKKKNGGRGEVKGLHHESMEANPDTPCRLALAACRCRNHVNKGGGPGQDKRALC